LILIVGVNNKDFWTLVFGGIFILLGVIARWQNTIAKNVDIFGTVT
jgi:hypothetical protein